MTRTLAVVALRELLRRRTAMVLMTLLPLCFYLVRLDQPGQALRFLTLGLGWTVATLSLFSSVTARELDGRLLTAGFSSRAVIWGRQLAVLAVGTVLACAYVAVVAVHQGGDRLPSVLVLLFTTVLVAAPLGAAVSLLLPRELEGALALLAVMSMQMLADPAGTGAKLLPFWSSREIATFVIDPVGTEYLWRGVGHALLVLVACWTAVYAGSRSRHAAARRTLPTPAPLADRS